MSTCYSEGWLRAFLDNELAPRDHAAVAAHLATCTVCRAELARLRAQAATVGTLLAAPAPHPAATAAAFSRLQARLPARPPAPATFRPSLSSQSPEVSKRRTKMHNLSQFLASPYRRLAAIFIGILLVAGLFALPPVRAAADQLLQIFRVQQVVFVPISPERIEELENLDFDEATLFVSEPEFLDEPTEPVSVTTAAEAEQLVGFPVREPVAFTTPPTATELLVTDGGTAQFQVNVEGARELLALLQIDDITLPDELGDEPITAEMEPSVIASYLSEGYKVHLVQGTSPDVTLPENVDLQQMGEAFLRLLGMETQQARELSQQIDWRTTLVVPLPTDVNTLRQVTINGADGLLAHSDHDGAREWHLYWQDGDRFMVLTAQGLSRDAVIALAESVQ